MFDSTGSPAWQGVMEGHGSAAFLTSAFRVPILKTAGASHSPLPKTSSPAEPPFLGAEPVGRTSPVRARVFVECRRDLWHVCAREMFVIARVPWIPN